MKAVARATVCPVVVDMAVNSGQVTSECQCSFSLRALRLQLQILVHVTARLGGIAAACPLMIQFVFCEFMRL